MSWAETRAKFARWWADPSAGPLVLVESPRQGAPPPPRPGWRRGDDPWWWLMQWLTGPGVAEDAPPDEMAALWDAHLASRAFHGEAFPLVWLNLGPGVLAALLTGRLRFRGETTWVDEPALVLEACRRLIGPWHQCHDALDAILRAEGQEGRSAWMGLWCPDTWYPLQCDFCAMLSPKQFDRLVLPILAEQCARLNHAIYHLDGPGQLPHVPSLLSLRRLGGVQWVPGASRPQAAAPEWRPLYARIQRAGKRLVMNNGVFPHEAEAIRRTVAPEGLLMATWAATEAEGRRLARALA